MTNLCYKQLGKEPVRNRTEIHLYKKYDTINNLETYMLNK